MAYPIPTIVFQVDLSNVNQIGFLNPDMYTENADLGRAAIAAKANQRRVLIPGLPGRMYEIQHGKQITAHGQEALYLLKSYGPSSTNPLLQVISESYVQQ